LDNLASIGGDLNLEVWWGMGAVSGNPNLTDLSGLHNLISIGGNFSVIFNNSLLSFTGLEELTSIGGYLEIENNSSLASLTGLDNINSGSITDLYISYNDTLSQCAVQSVCDYLTSPNANIGIEGNAPGCNSPEEVDSACVYLSNEEVNHKPDFSIYPNPASGEVIIAFNLEHAAAVNLKVMNSIGQVVSVILDENMSQGIHQVSWNTEGLQGGLYFLELRAKGERKASVKLIKC